MEVHKIGGKKQPQKPMQNSHTIATNKQPHNPHANSHRSPSKVITCRSTARAQTRYLQIRSAGSTQIVTAKRLQVRPMIAMQNLKAYNGAKSKGLQRCKI